MQQDVDLALVPLLPQMEANFGRLVMERRREFAAKHPSGFDTIRSLDLVQDATSGMLCD